ncbi:MAG TPA: DUF2279 domain-containing protein, partial [Hymenobacter sp.]|nr:DUF2279 domain-containing protein [Hymenobacter sp.]
MSPRSLFQSALWLRRYGTLAGAAVVPLLTTAQVPLASAVALPAAALPYSLSQPVAADSSRLHRRLPLLAGGLAVTYTGSLYLLSKSWYTGERVPLHWFNDLPQWKQMDKVGHFWGAFHQSRGAVDMLRWAGVPDRRAVWYGGFVGFLLLSPIELLDGRDPAYGASATDLAANFLGSAGL